jgi:hypothetical protein
MEDLKQVVNLAVEAAPVIDRTPIIPVEVVGQEQPTEASVVAEPILEPAPIPVVQPTNADVDEFGVPWKNRAMEWKRKSEEVIEKLPQMIDEKLSKFNQPQQPTYTYEQLEAYKLQNSADPNVVSWATGEQRKMNQAENRKLFEEVVGGREKVNKIELIKQQSLSYVQNTYPEAFKRDVNGVPTAWDESSPITQQIFGLMRTPELAQNPQGLAAAADMAYGRVARAQVPQLQAKVQQGKADIKQAQKASLTEGAGRRVVPNAPPQQVAIDNLRKTGSPKDAEQAIGALLRQRGIIVD